MRVIEPGINFNNYNNNHSSSIHMYLSHLMYTHVARRTTGKWIYYTLHRGKSLCQRIGRTWEMRYSAKKDLAQCQNNDFSIVFSRKYVHLFSTLYLLSQAYTHVLWRFTRAIPRSTHNRWLHLVFNNITIAIASNVYFVRISQNALHSLWHRSAAHDHSNTNKNQSLLLFYEQMRYMNLLFKFCQIVSLLYTLLHEFVWAGYAGTRLITYPSFYCRNVSSSLLWA